MPVRLVARPRLQVDVAQLRKLSGAFSQRESRGDAPQRDDQGEEWVRRAALTPVGEGVAAVADEDVAVVEIVVCSVSGRR